MLSVVVYGRNDSHGYNLPRRAALSLNCIAEVLDAPGDEIVFVDYNTPDALPTFPESIADTLTARAKALLRTIRVRPSFHEARFAAGTRLPVLEPIARNIALRRLDPRNAWVLSTNTDMAFVLDGGQSLSSLVAALAPGLYHAPRFETPEILWETLDRLDPEGALARLGAWGRGLWLDEVVRAGPDAVFDGPGDFQLFPREAGFAVGGFEEAMIHGWHVDANFARRLRLKYGRIDEAPPLLRGYHCGHTREATRYHAAGAVQNDERRFVAAVETPESSTAQSGWGFPDETFEEIRLDAPPSAPAALEAALAGEAPSPGEAFLTPESHGTIAYHPPHVLPHLLNLVAHERPQAALFYAGCRADMAALFAAAWTAMPGGRRLLVPQSAPRLSPEAGAETAPDAEALARADLFVFEFGAAPGARDDDAGAAIGAAMRLFDAAVDNERARLAAGAPPRRFILVNAIHNAAERAARAALAATLSPYSTRVRSGYVRAPEPLKAESSAPFANGAGAARWAGRIGAFFAKEAPSPTLSRAVRAEDWARPEWRDAAGLLPGLSLDAADRSDAVWEAASIAEALDDVLKPGAARLLFVAPAPDMTAAGLANAARLDWLATPGAAAPDWRARLALEGAHAPQAVRLLASPQEPEDDAYDAAIAPAETLRRLGRLRAAGLVRLLCEKTRPGGRVVLGAYARYARFTGRATLPATMLAEQGLAAAFARLTPLRPVGGADFSLTAATLDLIADRDGGPGVGAPLVYERRGAALARILFVLEKRDAPAANWTGLALRFALGR